ncbi:MAG: T9SS type A sorting domain-containing protein, partial [Saprospiraceae bacterium]|nr:T9SS type A sorting domain-containing protein [Saprospiraceae bacterium]
PATFEEYKDFYDQFEGGDPGQGHAINPHTGEPYEPQIVPRADYARVLAEFWADGPDSETPPGHWFTILNTVAQHPELEKRFRGEGPVLDDLEWDVKAYFTLGGAVHDAAVTAWGIKGWYDYIRPISAIRYMSGLGQSSDPNLPSYHPAGMPLVEGFIELVEEGDPLAEADAANIGKVKLYAWRGPDFIEDPDTSVAGVGWILGENWWPYQRPSFVTPNCAGYISGHSTFSRAAAEVMTLITGDPYFPGGMGEFYTPKNQFLVFEDGPSVDMTLQWATYRDASDQTSLSRIWGGIHPPVDDIPGRLIGEKIGTKAFQKAEQYFTGTVTSTDDLLIKNNERGFTLAQNRPNPFSEFTSVSYFMPVGADVSLEVYDAFGRLVVRLDQGFKQAGTHTATWRPQGNEIPGLYLYRLRSADGSVDLTKKMTLAR